MIHALLTTLLSPCQTHSDSCRREAGGRDLRAAGGSLLLEPGAPPQPPQAIGRELMEPGPHYLFTHQVFTELLL